MKNLRSSEADGSERAQRGIQSVEVGGQLLWALVRHGGSMALKDLAQAAGMAAGRAHPYLVSYGRLGLVEQDSASGRYSLGPLALQLGMISLRNTSPVNVAAPTLTQLALDVGQTVALASWDVRGPTVIRVEEAPTPVFASLRSGTVLSVSGTASGRLFCAYFERERAKTALEEERHRAARSARGTQEYGKADVQRLPNWREFEVQLADVRKHGMSRSEGEVVKGISAMAAPIFDAMGSLTLALISVGPVGTFNTAWDGPIARTLRQYSADISRRLGTPST